MWRGDVCLIVYIQHGKTMASSLKSPLYKWKMFEDSTKNYNQPCSITIISQINANLRRQHEMRGLNICAWSRRHF
jgi:hypothetical protein